MRRSPTGLFDVVIVEMGSRLVDTIAGERMVRTHPYGENAERRLETVLGRINDRYFAAIVPTGRFAVGDKFVSGRR